MNNNVEISWQPQPGPQTACIHCPTAEILYGGARGGGKTDAAIGKLLIHAERYGADFTGIFIRRELTQLAGVIERSKEIYNKHGAEYLEAKKMWRFPNGAKIYFKHLEKDSDAEKLQGWSVQMLVFEEAGNFPNYAPIAKLKGILRSSKNVPTQILYTANPGGPGHSWIKSRFIDPAPLGYKILTEKDDRTGMKTERIFIPAKVTDNKLLLASDPMYVARLAQTGSPELVSAWLDGRWDTVDGQFFDFSTERHVLRSSKLPEWWTRFRSFDWGSARPFACYWWAVASEDWISHCGKTVPAGALVAYREWYGVRHNNDGELMPNQGLRLYAEEIGAGIAERERDDPKIHYGVIDPAALAQDGGPSQAERMTRGSMKAGARVFWRPADNKRTPGRGAAGGWDALRSRLDGIEMDKASKFKAPMIFFFDSCIHAIRTLPMMQHCENNPEDVNTEGEDHCADAIRYACTSRPWARPTPSAAKPITTIDKISFGELTRVMDSFHGAASDRIH